MEINVGIVGATGYAGAELVRLIAGHPEVTLSVITSRRYEGIPIRKVYPALAKTVDLTCEAYIENETHAKADLFFTALPHKLPLSIVPELLTRGKKIVDLSADFRFNDAALYEAHYQTHSAKKALEKAVYGLCEIYGDYIMKTELVGNPGCYPTSILLPLIPLIAKRLIKPETIVADSKSGVSGAGRSVSLTTHFCEVNESYKAYKVAEHRHNPEIDEKLGLAAGKEVHATFVPHLVPMSRGMLSTIYAELMKGIDEKDLRDCLAEKYESGFFIRIMEPGVQPDTRNVRGTNFCDIGVSVDEKSRRVILTSAIDNLGKGAAGQAVQNMNIMLGLEETSGLDAIPYPL